MMENWNEKLITAASLGTVKDIKLCLQNAADVDYQADKGYTALMNAARRGNLEIMRFLLDSGCKKDTTEDDGWTALMMTAVRGQLETTRLLLDRGCNKDITNSIGFTALMLTALTGKPKVTRLLIDRGCKKDTTSKIDGVTALHLAAQNGHLQVTRCLVEQGGISPWVTTPKGRTPYDLAVARPKNDPGQKEVVEYLRSVISKHARNDTPKTSGKIQKTPIEEDEVPTEIKSMTDRRSIGLYLNLLESGSEKKRDIRLVVVGEKGAGKTSLIKKLFGEEITGVTSTNGIEIHTIKCKANSDDGLWTKLKGNNKETDIYARLLKPYEERLQNKEIFEEPVEEEANLDVMENTPVTAVGESKKSDTVSQHPEIVKPPGTTASNANPQGITASNVNPPGITASQVNPPRSTQQPDQPLEQARKDIVTMLTDKSKVDLQDKEEYATLLLWDFAGDEEFYHTHQTFLSPDAIYLVVAKLNEADDKKAQEMFQLWMNSIHCYCRLEEHDNKSASNTAESKKETKIYLEPPVILVGSHKDQVERSDGKEIDDACSNFVSTYTSTITEDVQKHIHDEYLISNTVMNVNDDNVFQKIRQAILVLARKMRTWNTDYPLKFIQLEKHLQEMKKELPIISMQEIKQLSLETPLPLKDKELILFLKYHHEIRALVFFEDLPHYIILDTQWLADAFKCIVTADKFRPGPGRHLGTKTWADLHDKGILSSTVLEYIIKTNKNIFKFEREENNYILNVMEKFDIIIPPNISDKCVTEETPQYYVPCMVKARPELINIYEMFKVANEEKSAWLCFEFSFLPPHLIHHLIASMNRKYEVAECVDSDSNKKKIALFKGLGVFECKQEPAKLQKILVMTGLNLIQIQVWEFAKSAKMDKGVYKHIADFVTGEIHNIISKRFKMSNVNFEEKWACGLSNTKPECAIIMNNFTEELITEYRCRRCNENHTFIGEWSEQQNKTPSKQECNPHCPDISDILDQMMTRLVISVNDRRTIEQKFSQEAKEQKLLEIVIKRGEPNKTVCIDVLQQYSGYKDLAIELKNANSRLPTENTEIQDVPDYKVRLQKNYLKIINTIQHNSQ